MYACMYVGRYARMYTRRYVSVPAYLLIYLGATSNKLIAFLSNALQTIWLQMEYRPIMFALRFFLLRIAFTYYISDSQFHSLLKYNTS